MLKQIPPIVIVAYNRPKSLIRILNSISKAAYPSKNITLIISIDKGNNTEIIDIAKAFKWEYGNKIVELQKKNLGLRNHILKCGCLSIKYGSIIILEDDLYVSSQFYSYAYQALTFSQDKDYISGISLYNHQFNQQTYSNFSCLEDGYDNWYFQYAASWGQAWTKEQFQNFYHWYQNNQELIPSPEIPKTIISWSNNSWLKYFIVYLIETNKYFMYPKVSLSTNFSDLGSHIDNSSTMYQVPLLQNSQRNMLFSKLKESKSIYNAFYENITLYKHFNLKPQEVCVSLYGLKIRQTERYYLTDKILNYKIVKSFGRSLKPIESNIIENIDGYDIFLYDTLTSKKNNFKNNHYTKVLYSIKDLSRNDARHLYITLLLRQVKRLFNFFNKS